MPARSGATRLFLAALIPFSPWVFGTAAIALAYLPTLIAPQVAGHAMAFSAVSTGTTAVAAGHAGSGNACSRS